MASDHSSPSVHIRTRAAVSSHSLEALESICVSANNCCGATVYSLNFNVGFILVNISLLSFALHCHITESKNVCSREQQISFFSFPDSQCCQRSRILIVPKISRFPGSVMRPPSGVFRDPEKPKTQLCVLLKGNKYSQRKKILKRFRKLAASSVA